MRVINIHTEQLEEFFLEDVPPYYILSHRWGRGEISFKDYKKQLTSAEYREKLNTDFAGYRKVKEACAFCRRWSALDGGVNYLWVDTCCIDKRSSAELSEAINSMYAWYQQARTCFAYLVDVPTYDQVASYEDREALRMTAFARSDWFTRGWTLQELLAPDLVVFCDADWQVLGHKCRPHSTCKCRSGANVPKEGGCLLRPISVVTTIPEAYFKYKRYGGRGRFQPSIAQKLSWAAKRKTTRVEDEAYCLLGIFGINMPLLYGEGRKAFIRLQEELIKTSRDQSIFAWRAPSNHATIPVHGEDGDLIPQAGQRLTFGLLAPSPAWFASSGTIFHSRHQELRRSEPFAITSEGLEMKVELTIVEVARQLNPNQHLSHTALQLNCRRFDNWNNDISNVNFVYADLPHAYLLLTETHESDGAQHPDRGRLFRRFHADNLGEGITAFLGTEDRRVRMYVPLTLPSHYQRRASSKLQGMMHNPDLVRSGMFTAAMLQTELA